MVNSRVSEAETLRHILEGATWTTEEVSLVSSISSQNTALSSFFFNCKKSFPIISEGDCKVVKSWFSRKTGKVNGEYSFELEAIAENFFYF